MDHGHEGALASRASAHGPEQGYMAEGHHNAGSGNPAWDGAVLDTAAEPETNDDGLASMQAGRSARRPASEDNMPVTLSQETPTPASSIYLTAGAVEPSQPSAGSSQHPRRLSARTRARSAANLTSLDRRATGPPAPGRHDDVAMSHAARAQSLSKGLPRGPFKPSLAEPAPGSNPVLKVKGAGTAAHAPSPLRPLRPVPPPPAVPPAKQPSAVTGLAAKVQLFAKAPPGGPKRAPFVPAEKLDPKQLKEAVRRWYRFDRHGTMTIVQAGKQELTRSLGVHSRDLRILDVNIKTSSYHSCILCRERALVINLEYIQVVVTTDTTLMLNAERATELAPVKLFVEDLQRRLAAGVEQHDASVPWRSDGERAAAQTVAAADMPDSARDAHKLDMPYELKVLEVCLDHVAMFMSDQVKDLEDNSAEALKALTTRVTPATLERIRRIKNRMVRLSTRVETIRTMLEKYLGDDDDLAELHLTGQRCIEEERAEKLRLRDQRRFDRLERYNQKRTRKLDEDPNASEPSSVSNSTFTISDVDASWLSSQAEKVLEPYFMSFDNTWNRIQAVGEFIDDTEDFVKINIDAHRNQLIQVDLLLTAGSFCAALVTVTSGIFGMNLTSNLEEEPGVFNTVTIASVIGAVVLLTMFVVFMRAKKLAFV